MEVGYSRVGVAAMAIAWAVGSGVKGIGQAGRGSVVTGSGYRPTITKTRKEKMGMKRFEYMTLTEGMDELKSKLDMLGEKGWELVDILPGNPPEAFFKRRRSDKGY